jgi:hypothetical protein
MKKTVPLASTLLAELKKREISLFENDAFLAAIYMDPRYKTTLSQTDKARARMHVTKTWINIRNLKEKDIEIEDREPDAVLSEDEVDLLIKERENCENADTNGDALASRISLILDDYDKWPRIAKKLNILEYWERQKIHSELFEISQVVLAVPVTQVSVERAFSGLKFVLSCQRGNISKENLEDVLLIRCNSKFENDK